MSDSQIGQRGDRDALDHRDRRNAGRLGLVLRCGTVAAVVVIIIGTFAVPLGAASTGRWLQRAGMMIMVGTPVGGLISLAIGFRTAGTRRYLILIAVILALIALTATGVVRT
ncbi:hypothetical protein [Microlunatus soli]|uniref:Uncharacterized protein n=1 Tax=Microlunatus soli TaxID=630515 RepID=A0A1H1MHF1_9ACTN|nr:hypothetical protein [Microlunatus soli]SDR86042.1 hypothetical protein SAMN04489812_0133 [Microlunatus soli]